VRTPRHPAEKAANVFPCMEGREGTIATGALLSTAKMVGPFFEEML
jgi:hypothetical protein